MTKTTISLDIPKSAAERAARSVLFDILGQYRVGDINHEQAAKAIEHWRTVNTSFQGEDAVERVARIRLIASKCFDPTGFEIDGTPVYAVAEWKAAESALDAILATSLVPDEAAIRADEREKMLDKVCESLLVLSRGDESIIGAARVALNNAAFFICGADRAKRAIRSGGGE